MFSKFHLESDLAVQASLCIHDANEMKSSGEADQCLCCLLEFSCLETSMVFTSKVFLGNCLSLA